MQTCGNKWPHITRKSGELISLTIPFVHGDLIRALSESGVMADKMFLILIRNASLKLHLYLR